jgi:hypothetical protein
LERDEQKNRGTEEQRSRRTDEQRSRRTDEQRSRRSDEWMNSGIEEAGRVNLNVEAGDYC